MSKEKENRERFERIFIENKDSFYRLALRITKNASDAQDLLQETCKRSFEAFGQLKRGRSVRSWMMRIMINIFREELRKRKSSLASEFSEKTEEAFTMLPASDITPEQKTIEMETILRIKAAIEELPLEYRVAVVLAYVERYTYEEIAEAMDCPIGTVMSRLYRGRRILRIKLAGYESGLMNMEDSSKGEHHNGKLINLEFYRYKKDRGSAGEGLKI